MIDSTDPLLPFLYVRLATLLTVSQLESVLSWTNLPPDWRAVFEQHLRWAKAAQRAEREAAGDE